MPYQNFETLYVWNAARELKIDISALVKIFPNEEKFRLADQLIRSSRSVCSQIAEGHGRNTNADKTRFCIIARGSLSETLNHLIDANDENFIDENILSNYREKIKKVEMLLNGYINYLLKTDTKKLIVEFIFSYPYQLFSFFQLINFTHGHQKHSYYCARRPR